MAQSALRTRHGITVVGVKRPRQDFTYAKPDTVVVDGDLLIISGPTDKVERFAALP
ncbi:MAG: TrkA C-terminal domain-containing protein [Brevundimonas sp.]|nr:TrkA C-terminal domain-containing protein [Brevundimonas sp.]